MKRLRLDSGRAGSRAMTKCKPPGGGLLHNGPMHKPGHSANGRGWRIARAILAGACLIAATAAHAMTGTVISAGRGELTPSEAWARLARGEGEDHAAVRFQPSGPRQEQWFLLDTGPGDPAGRHLVLPYAGLDLAELYLPQSLGEPAARAGDSIGVRRWTLPYLHPVLPLGAHGGRVLLLVRNTHPTSFPWRLETAGQFEAERKWVLLLLGAYQGLVALVLVLSAVNAVALRDPAHAVYAAYVLVLAATQATLTGVAGYYYWSDHPLWSDLAAVVFPMLGTSLLALFVWLVVRPLPRRWIGWLLGLHAATGVVLATIFVLVGREPAFVAANAYFILTFPLCVPLLLWYALRRSPAGWWIAAGLAALLIGSVLQALRNVGMLPMSLATQYGSQIGAAVEIPLLLIALYRRSRDQRDLLVRQAALQDRDPLTGLVNDYFTRRQVGQAMQRARASPGQVAVLRLRVSNLGAIAQESGQQVASAAMLHAASCVRRIAGEGDTVGRLAEGDFVAVLEHAGGEGPLRAGAAHVLALGLRPEPRLAGHALRFHVAFTLAPDAWADAEALLAQLEHRLEAIAQAPQRAIQELRPPKAPPASDAPASLPPGADATG